MGTLMLGGIIAIVLAMIFGGSVGWLGFGIAIILSLMPIEGFKEKRCDKEITLIKLRNCGVRESNAYIKLFGKKATFAFDNSDEYDLKGIAYQERTVKGKIKVYEDQSCKEAVLKVFKRKPNREVFAFAPFSTQTEYVFYVPLGAVIGKDSKKRKNKELTISVV